MRTGFVREREVPVSEALRRSLPTARAWLAGRDLPVPAGTLGGAEALETVAARVGTGGLGTEVRALWGAFAIRVGARRLSDAAVCLATLGMTEAAAVAAEQARLVGALQHPTVTGNDQALAACLLRLAPTYERLRSALDRPDVRPSFAGDDHPAGGKRS
ncbi:hypothetical protein GCM10022245_29570 [Streptomyces mayteni]